MTKKCVSIFECEEFQKILNPMGSKMLKNGLSDEMIIFLLYMKIKRGTFYLHCLTHVWTVFVEHRVSIFVNKIEQFNRFMVKNLFKIWLNITVFRNSLIFRYCFPRCLATHKPRVTWEWILNRKSSIRGRQVIWNFITFSQHRKTIFSGWRKNFLKWFWIFDKFSVTKCFTLSKKQLSFIKFIDIFTYDSF